MVGVWGRRSCPRIIFLVQLWASFVRPELYKKEYILEGLHPSKPRNHKTDRFEANWKTLSATLIISGFDRYSSNRIIVLDKSITWRYAVEKVYRIIQ
jgi:hypothetical protein